MRGDRELGLQPVRLAEVQVNFPLPFQITVVLGHLIFGAFEYKRWTNFTKYGEVGPPWGLALGSASAGSAVGRQSQRQTHPSCRGAPAQHAAAVHVILLSQHRASWWLAALSWLCLRG